jgi:hypothetical protein
VLYYSGERLTLGKLYVPFSVVRHGHGAGIDVGDAMHFVGASGLAKSPQRRTALWPLRLE